MKDTEHGGVSDRLSVIEQALLSREGWKPGSSVGRPYDYVFRWKTEGRVVVSQESLLQSQAYMRDIILRLEEDVRLRMLENLLDEVPLSAAFAIVNRRMMEAK